MKNTDLDPKSLSDIELLRRSYKRPELFEELVSRYQRLFVRKAASILGNEDDAKDVVQEAFVRIYLGATKYKPQPGASFSSWAYTVLVNQCYTMYRKRQRSSVVSFDLEPELAEVLPDPVSLNAIENKFTADYVARMLSKLPLMLRRAVQLHFIDGLPQKEVAEIEGVTHGVVRQRIHRAKKEIRRLDGELKLAYAPAAKQLSQTTK